MIILENLTQSPPKTNRQRLMHALRYVISFTAIAAILILFRAQLPLVVANLARVDRPLFFVSLGVYYVGLLFIARRLQMFMQGQGTDLSFGNSYYVNLIALFFNNVLPSSLGGEAVKAYYVYRNTNGRMASIGAILVDRLLGLLTLMCLGLASVLLSTKGMESKRVMSSMVGMAAVCVPLIITIFSKTVGARIDGLKIPFMPSRITDKLKEVFLAIHFYRKKKGILVKAVLLSLCAQALFVLNNFFLAQSLGIPIPLSFFFFFFPMMALVSVAPSMNGVGIREAAYLFYLADFATPDKALALSLLTTFSLILIGISGGVAYAIKGGIDPKGVSVSS